MPISNENLARPRSNGFPAGKCTRGGGTPAPSTQVPSPTLPTPEASRTKAIPVVVAPTELRRWGTAPAGSALGAAVATEAWTGGGMEAEEPLLEAGLCTTQKAEGMRCSDDLSICTTQKAEGVRGSDEQLRFGFGFGFGTTCKTRE